MKWFPLIFLAVTPCWAGTLRGQVTNAKGRGLASAEVTIFNELAPIFLQVGKTDSNGNYHFKVSPGLYRIIIVRKDYVPHRERVVMEGNKTRRLVHQLTDLELNQSHYTKIIKEMYRQSNKDPYREMGQGYSIAQNLNGPQHKDFIASMLVNSQTALNGEFNRDQLFQMGTQVRENLAVDSRFGRLRSGLSQTETQLLQASVSLNHRGGDMDFEAQSLQQMDSELEGRSHRLAIAGRYGDRVKAETGLNFSQSDMITDEFQQWSLLQDLRYRLGLVPINQSLSLTQWEHNSEQLGQQADLHTDILLGPKGRWGVALDYQSLDLARENYKQTTFWLTRKQWSSHLPVMVENHLGVLHQDQGNQIVQNHLVQASTHRWEITAQYEEDQHYTHLSSEDIFGQHMANRALPFASESFIENKRKESSLLIGLPHTAGFRSEVTWERAEQDTRLLAAASIRAFNPQANHEREAWSYRLDASNWGSQFEIAHMQHGNNQIQFDQFVVSYSQWVRPFRDKGRGFMFALQMGNHPSMPAWWLLEDMLWDPETSGNWYEGQLRVQF